METTEIRELVKKYIASGVSSLREIKRRLKVEHGREFHLSRVIRDLVDSGVTAPVAIQREIEARYGVRVGVQYVSNVKTRLKKRQEFARLKAAARALDARQAEMETLEAKAGAFDQLMALFNAHVDDFAVALDDEEIALMERLDALYRGEATDA